MKGVGGGEGEDELQFIAVYFWHQIYFFSSPALFSKFVL